MLIKLSGLARTLYILLAIIAGFVALGTVDVALALVVLGLIAGIAMTKDNYVPAAATAIALPIIGGALGHIPPLADSSPRSRRISKWAWPVLWPALSQSSSTSL